MKSKAKHVVTYRYYIVVIEDSGIPHSGVMTMDHPLGGRDNADTDADLSTIKKFFREEQGLSDRYPLTVLNWKLLPARWEAFKFEEQK
jgi:hypothetical protein